ncbi:hypothetical protein [Streptomyces sp. NBC_01264]|uniref:hypothetical protein n=1 Tax=Streptomyces sp. NBC_01264 TaxID=2903804 RepID=UPI00224E2BA1|nr:hypothetical protein [Streptomyces sp. NBC_01264]MCX4778534.1 hypothetical protein [Streptomyces sp. NBC_01264]
MCDVVEDSPEGAALRRIVGPGEYRTEAYGTSVERATDLTEDLRGRAQGKDTGARTVCAYVPSQQAKSQRVRFEVNWAPRDAPKEPPLPGGVPFDANGTSGETSDIASRLYLPCALPGDLRPLSDEVWLKASGSFTVNIPREDIDQEARDRQTAFTYLMARRVTEALGCENKPLAKPPVVKPLPTP